MTICILIFNENVIYISIYVHCGIQPRGGVESSRASASHAAVDGVLKKRLQVPDARTSIV